MKKISYSLRIGIIGNIKHLKGIFLESLTKSALETNLSNNYSEFLLVFKQIPIKIKISLYDNLDNLIYDYENVQKLDVIIITLDLYDPDTLNIINKTLIEEFNETFSFQGISILVGMNVQHIFKNSPSKKFKISRFQLEKTTKELNFIYCFEIFNNNKDVIEIYNTILNDFHLRFQYSSPELFEKARKYGKKLLS